LEILIGLGGNIGDPPSAFKEACGQLSERHRLIAVSSLYGSLPEGPSQPEFHNAAALLEVDCSPPEFLVECQAIERAAGRDRGEGVRWGPRSLDIDLLLVRGVVRRGSYLVIPHPRFAERSFALVPSAELVPEWEHPIVGRTIRDLAEEASQRDPGAVWKVEKSKNKHR